VEDEVDRLFSRKREPQFSKVGAVLEEVS
jgi:hypothetical protein